MLLTALAAGSLLGAAMVAPIQKWLGRSWLLEIDFVGTILMLAVPALTSNLWFVSAAIFFGGFGSATWSVAVATILQRLIPDELLGRVYSAYLLVGWGTLSLGAITCLPLLHLADLGRYTTKRRSCLDVFIQTIRKYGHLSISIANVQ